MIVRKSHALAAMTVALAAPFVSVASAGASTADKAQAEVLGTVKIAGDGSATVIARYTCPNGFHLWVSAKQVESGLPDPALREEGSSSISAAWLQSHPTDFTCDGRWHVDTSGSTPTSTR